jgi:Ca2+-transporting ATPase
VVLDETISQVLTTALAASELDAFDPMESAIREAAGRWLPDQTKHDQNKHGQTKQDEARSLLREYDLTPELLAVTHVWHSPRSVLADIAVKGAPETVFDLCQIEPLARKVLLERIAVHARSGLRVLAVASGQHDKASLPATPRGFTLRLLGIVCFADPLRASVPASLAECYAAGIRVIMITGDHPGTALAIAAQAGFDTKAGTMSGQDIEQLSDDELRVRVRNVNIFARAKPEHKLRLVQALKANGDVVAMTGDGVNDAPALKAAHIGVAMGGRGTDVAREAAVLVLVNDDFASLVAAVRLGRRIYANIRHAMSFIVAVHIPIAGLGLLPVLFGWPLIFFPMHVLFLEFVIDPACALVFEADLEAPDIMKRKPRGANEALFSRKMLRRNVLLGSAVLGLEIAIYGIALALTDEDRARTLAFIGLVVSNLALIFVSRSRSESLATIYGRTNKVYWWIVGMTATALAIVAYVVPAAAIFHFSAPSPAATTLVVLVAISMVSIGGHLLRERSDAR